MNVKEVASEGLKKTYECSIAAKEVENAVDAELKNVSLNVKIAGFRPGHVPVKILQQRYGKSVEADVIRNLVSNAISKTVNDNKIRPALSPEISDQNYKDGGDLAFTFSVEALPDVPEMKFDDISLEREQFTIEESDIDDGLARLAERNPSPKKLADSAKAKMGNVVSMDFVGKIDGTPFEGGTAQGFAIELGSGRLIPGFEEQLVGVKAGDEKEVKVPFPAEYFNKDVAGKEAVFEVKVTEVSELETPEVDDAFAQSKGFSDIRALREAVRDQLLKDFNSIVRTRLKKQLFDALDERCSFPLPQGMVELEYNSIWERLQQAKAAGDETVAGKSDDELKKEYRAISERRVRLGILLAEIGRRERLQASREELTRALIQHASQFPGQEQKVMEFYRAQPERLDELRGPILEEKAVDWILNKTKFDDRTISTKDLIDGEEGENAAAQKKEKAAKPKTTKKKASKTDEE